MAEWRTEVSSLALQIAAENCRQHKIDKITVLEEEVSGVTLIGFKAICICICLWEEPVRM